MQSPAKTILEDRDAEVVAETARVLEPIARRFFRYAMRGLDRLPPPPCLVVGNHSGAGVVEVPCMLIDWHKRFGEERPAWGLTNVVSMKNPIFGRWLRQIGAVPASYGHARSILEAGGDCLVFPGGDIDSFRPFWQPRKVIFGQRRGYVRLALEAKVPIVPMATLGSHLTYWMAPGNEAIAKLLNLKRPSVRLESVPITVGAIAAIAATGLAFASVLPPIVAAAFVAGALLPFPSRITTEVLPAIDLSRELPEDMPEEERVERGHELVHGALQRALETMKH